MEKQCTKCKETKKSTEFYARKDSNQRFRSACKSCVMLDDKTYRNSNPEKRRIKQQNYIAKDKINFYKKARAKHLQQTFGLTVEQYNNMVIHQGNLCAICNQPEIVLSRGVLKKLSIDHCHITGKVRQLLCLRCNSGLGFFKDSEDILDKAIQYLKSHRD